MNSIKSRFRDYLMILASALVVLAAWFPIGPIQADDDDDFETDQVVVKLNLAQGATIEQLNAKYGTITLSTVLQSAGIYLLQIPAGSTPLQVVDNMEEDIALVVYVEPNYIGDLPVGGSHTTWAWGGNDPASFAGQYAPDLINLPEAHTLTRGAGVIVAVMDSGVQFDHPALADVLLNGYDYIDDDTDPTDVGNGIDDDGDGRIDEGYGHGTHVAGIVHLVAPEASILPLRVLDADGRGSVFLLAEAIQYAVNRGARVVNMSLGLRTNSNLLDETIYNAAESGVVFVGAAGNSNSSTIYYPAGYGKVIGVAAVDANDQRAGFSNYGNWIDIAAPGVQITSTFPISGYASWSGTSMAAPFVAGQAALLSTFPPNSEIEIEDRIRESAQRIDSQNPNHVGKLGTGRIDVYASMTVFGTPPPTSTPTPTATPTPSATPTATPTASATPTATPTASATPTATPTTTPEGTLVSPGGGNVSASGASTQAQLSIPAGAVNEPIRVVLETVADVGAANMSPVVGEAWRVRATNSGSQPVSTLARPATVTITLSSVAFNAVDVGDLAVARWDTARKQWTLLPFTLNTAGRTLAVESNQLGTFAVLADMTERLFLPGVSR